MAKQKITIKIVGKPFSLTIDSEKEELYRLAVTEVNDYVQRLMTAHFSGFSKEDCLAMTAFQFALARLRMAQSRTVGNEDVQQLAALNDEIEHYFDSLR